MATRSVVGYKNEQGQFRGTYVHWDGYPSHMIPALNGRLELEGFEALKAWVDKGVAGGGFSEVSAREPYGDNNEPWNLSVGAEEYGYLILPDSVVLVHNMHYEPVPEIEIPAEHLIDWEG